VATVAELFALAWQNHQAGNLSQAEQFYRKILQTDPAHADAWGYLGTVCQAQGKLTEAEMSFRRVVQLLPANASAHNCLAVVLVQNGKLEEAAASLEGALRCQPDNPETHNNLGSVLTRLGRTAEAEGSYRQALRLKPEHAQAHYNLGLALKTAGQQAAAQAEFQEALRCQPDFAEARHELASACFNQGTALQSQGQWDKAAACYRQALGLNPNFAEAHNNLGLVLRQLGRLAEAVTCHRRALQLLPQVADMHTNLAGALKEDGQLVEAIASYRRALQLDLDSPVILGELISPLQDVCLWEDLEHLSEQIIKACAGDATRPMAGSLKPFTLLALPTPTTARQQGQCARDWAEQRFKLVRSPKSDVRSQDFGLRTSDFGLRTSDSGHSKITVGYLSADFHVHPVAYLIPELIEKHDRQRFAVFGYSYGPDDGSAIRRRLVKAHDRFVDLKDASFLDAARHIQADGVDILVDLTGYTGPARTPILALRPAPIQVNYLGYPGTMGAPFMDYIFVDDFVVPPQQQPFFTEKLVHLPGCYQVNDSQREIAARIPSRAECGLPDAGFVFCCFNNTYKITPALFDVWMRLLKSVPGSVLWLLEINRFAPANLRQEAQARGVAPQRLVFGPRLPLPDHLARHRLADLVLDTFPYNAHTTASDALWAGCPVLTMAGQTFPSRVAGSLLRTIGLPELIATSLQEYEELALRLARDAEFLDDLRARLQANRATSRLFDGGRFARSLEQAYLTMWEIHASGEQPRAFAVSPTCKKTSEVL